MWRSPPLLGYTGRMATVTFDTLQFVKRLESAGFSREHAVAVMEVTREAIDEQRARSSGSNAPALSDPLIRELRAMEQRLTFTFAAFITLAVGIVAALIKL